MKQAMLDGKVAQITSPLAGNRALGAEGVPWALDNDCFSASWNSVRWIKGLQRRRGIPNCLFATVPDVVGDAVKTLELWHKWHKLVEAFGYRPAFVLQDGCEFIPDGVRCVFIGGSTDWKLGRKVRELVKEAKEKGMWVHMGRVNSYTRAKYAKSIGCDSVDGTYIAFGPKINLPKLIKWMERVNDA